MAHWSQAGNQTGNQAARSYAPGGMMMPGKNRALARAEQIYRARRKRVAALPELAEFFHEPAWDILLDLFIAAERGRAVPVICACIGAAVPNTTGLRTIAQLERRGAIFSTTDPNDKRRRCLNLAEPLRGEMREYLESI